MVLNEGSFIYKEINYCIKNNIDFIANLGHSTILFSYKGKKILTDPFLSPHIFGIKRQKPALKPELIPKVDYILISHAHYDHLDINTLKNLNKNSVLIVPKNTGFLVKNLGFKDVIELKNWENFSNSDIEIHSLPVKHNNGRLPFFLHTGTNSYFVKFNGISFYFLGDSAYFKDLKKFGEMFNIDFAFLPIGGFKPEIIFKNFHMNPYQAVQAFKDLNAKCFVPIHYGTFHVIPPFVYWEKPLEKLISSVKQENLIENLMVVKPNHIATT